MNLFLEREVKRDENKTSNFSSAFYNFLYFIFYVVTFLFFVFLSWLSISTYKNEILFKPHIAYEKNRTNNRTFINHNQDTFVFHSIYFTFCLKKQKKKINQRCSMNGTPLDSRNNVFQQKNSNQNHFWVNEE